MLSVAVKVQITQKRHSKLNSNHDAKSITYRFLRSSKVVHVSLTELLQKLILSYLLSMEYLKKAKSS